MPTDTALMREALRTDRDQVNATKQLAASNRELARTLQRGWDALAIILLGAVDSPSPTTTVADAKVLCAAADALRKPKPKGGEEQ